MAKKSFKSLFLVGIGIILGIILYIQLSKYLEKSSLKIESPEVENLHTSDGTQKFADDVSESRRNSITHAVQRLSPAVVGINVTQVHERVRRSPFSTPDPLLRDFFPELFKDKRYRQEVSSLGSGFIISPDGYILTNEHVVENAKEIIITMTGGKKENAVKLGSDPTSDVALLKIDASDLPYVILGNSDNVILGEWAIAIGNPFGLFEINNRPTVTVGVVSALNRDFGEMYERVYQDMIQTDASINHGNSGGPLSNAMGEVIGMNKFIYTGGEGSVGIGFAIPINRISRLIEDLKKSEKIDRNFWIGIRVKNLEPVIAQKMGYSDEKGVLVTYIDRRSPAEKAGLHLGDIITKVGNIDIYSDKNVTEAIYQDDLRVGDRLKMRIWRNDEILDIELKLESIRNF